MDSFQNKPSSFAISFLSLLCLGILLFLFQQSLLRKPPVFLGFQGLEWENADGFLHGAPLLQLPSANTAVSWDTQVSNGHSRSIETKPFVLTAPQIELSVAGNLPRKLTRPPIVEIFDENNNKRAKWSLATNQKPLIRTTWQSYQFLVPADLIGKTIRLRLRSKPTPAADAWFAVRDRLNLYEGRPFEKPLDPLTPPTNSEILLALAFALSLIILLPTFQSLRAFPLALLFFTIALGIHFRSSVFIYYDEWHVLERFSKLGFAGVFHTHNEHFLPLFFTFYLLEAKIFADHYLCYTLLSLALHTLNTFLLISLLKRIGGNIPGSNQAALLLGLLFLLSSLHAETLQWAFEQCLILSQTATLLALNFTWDYFRTRRRFYFFSTTLCCLAAPLFFGNGFNLIFQIGGLVILLALWRNGPGDFHQTHRPKARYAFALLFCCSLMVGLCAWLYSSHNDSVAIQNSTQNTMSQDDTSSETSASKFDSEKLARIARYLYVGSQTGCVLRGLGLFPPLQMEAAPKLFKLWGEEEPRANFFLAHLGFGASLFILLFGLVLHSEKSWSFRCFLTGQAIIFISLALPALGRAQLGEDQSLSLRYHYSTFVGLAILLLPIVSGAFSILLHSQSSRTKRSLVFLLGQLYLCYFLTAQLFVGRRFEYFTEKGYLHRNYVQQLTDWNKRLRDVSPTQKLPYEGTGSSLQGLFPIHLDTITPGKHPDEIYLVLNWLNKEKYPLRAGVQENLP